MHINRRSFLSSSFFGASASAVIAQCAAAQGNSLFPLKDDDGKPVINYRLLAELSIEDLPGIVWTGAQNADVIFVEFFDYNCPFCRKAVADLDAIRAKDKNFRLGLINNAILSPASLQAAKVQQSVLKSFGPKRAYDFHVRLFAHRGLNDGPSALGVAKTMGLEVEALERSADGDDVHLVLTRQMNLAANLGFATTPSFMAHGVGILGYPGARTIERIISALRKCDKPTC
jgi:protein-disulfide isomerase